MFGDRSICCVLALIAALTAFVLHACVPAPNCGSALYTPTRFDDAFDGVCDMSDCSLREAVYNANQCPGPQTIELQPGFYELTIVGQNEDDALTGDLDITEDLTVHGMGPDGYATRIEVVDGDRAFDVFAPAEVEIGSMVLFHGGEVDGGCLRTEADLTLLDVGFLSCTAREKGGGIYNTGLLNCDGCGFNECVGSYGIGIANDTGGVMRVLNFSMVDSFYAVTGDPEQGGGLWNASGAEATVVGFEIHNVVADYGAGVFNAGELEIRNGSIKIGSANIDGGGLYTSMEGVTNGYDIRVTQNSADRVGGIFNKGLTHLYRSEVSKNSAWQGAGIFNEDATPGLRLQNVTVSGNYNKTPPPIAAAAIFNSGGDMLLEFITVADNDQNGIANVGGGTFTIESSIVAYNVGSNCIGAGSASLGHNIDDDGSCNFTSFNDLSAVDPMIADLALNGASTMTHALFHGSPALNSGSLDQCIAEDQRGISRPQGLHCDRGAYEGFVMQSLAPQITPLPPLLTVTPTETPTATPTPTSTPSACFYEAAMNAYCRASDYKESAEIALLLEGDEVELTALNPEFTHGQFLVESGRECWILLGLLTGPENPYGACDVPVIDPQPLPQDEAPPCREDLGEEECLASGGTWQEELTTKPYCICPD